MKDLIERLERASGPDRELDIAILRAISDKPWRWDNADPDVITWDEYGPGAAGNPVLSLEEFTASLDAALTLVPPDHSYELTQSAVPAPAFARVRIWDWRRGPKAIDPANEWQSYGNRPLAIALVIAALKARIAVERDLTKEASNG